MKQSSSFLSTALGVSAVACAAIGHAFAGTTAAEVMSTPDPSTPWEFRLEAYGWLTGLKGDVGAKGFTTGIDVGFDDIVSTIDMAAALQFEARHGRWGFMTDAMYVKLSVDGSPPGPLYNNAHVGMKQFVGELDVAYRVYESPKGFVDIYGGIRYTGISMDLSADVNESEVGIASATASQRVNEGLKARAAAIVAPKLAEFQTATVARRAEIEQEVSTAIQAEAEKGIKRQLVKELRDVGNREPRDLVRLDLEKASLAIKAQRTQLAKSTAQLKVAELKASVDPSKQNLVTQAKSRVSAAKADLSKAVNKALDDQLPVDKSADKDWIDPIIGVRAQWNINDRWFLASRGDVGGFGINSDFMWSAQATVGYNFTQKISAELGYRFLHTDYKDSGFTYDLDQSGFYTGLNFKF